VAKRPVVLAWEGKAEALSTLETDVPPLVSEEVLLGTARGSREATFDVRLVDDGAAGTRRIIFGDALDVARALSRQGLDGTVDLVYLDPPYGSGVGYRMDARDLPAYDDRWEEGAASHLDMLLPRLVAMRPLLKPTGSIWIQVDWRAGYLVRALCDEIFGRERFLNEIVWRRAPNLGRQARSGQFGRTIDLLIVYGASASTRLVPPGKLTPVRRASAYLDAENGRYFTLAPRGDYTDASVARLEREGRVYRTSKGTIAVKYWLETDSKGRLFKRQPVDALWTDVRPLRHAPSGERTGYPTQKPRALLERVLAAATPENGLVVDLFAGSGTTGAAAEALGRRFILGDASATAIATMRGRLLRQGTSSLSLERCGTSFRQASVRIEVTLAGAGVMNVELLSGDDASLVAWAISLSADSPFRVHWHRERETGRAAAELSRVATVPVSSVVRARAYFADGTVGEAFAKVATLGDAEPMRRIEEPA
jgi:DNA modification methylase